MSLEVPMNTPADDHHDHGDGVRIDSEKARRAREILASPRTLTLSLYKRPKEAIESIDFLGSIPFLGVHVAAVAFVVATGFNWVALGFCLFLYFIRMFAITGGYHRYFSHRTFKTSRWFQFCLAFLGASSAQQGPLWWAAHHRHHHRHSDTEEDIHSPGLRGLWWAHCGWVMCRKYGEIRWEEIKDFAKFPELKFLDKYHVIAPITLGVATFMLGLFLQEYFPQLGTTAWQMLGWGFFFSTVLLYHGTFTINSLSHIFGKRRFETTDESKNSFILSIITLGEGWHNNHHRYPASERQGMYWWELDITHYLLRVMSLVGLVWDIKTHPKSLYEEAQRRRQAFAEARAHSAPPRH
ncbi:MAG: acyl-CoA desaturase [Candidatus Sumerlaeia bacterium]|nr:acyl-CoA desaturase [Candidatus Sumerlaeia bacterium]